MLCAKWILLGKLREEAEWQLTSGLYKKYLRKDWRIPPNCPWWLFLDGRTPLGFSSCSYGFTYVFSKLSTNSIEELFFRVVWSTVKKKKKGEVMSMKESLSERHCCMKDKPTGLGLGPLRNFIFFAVHSFSDSLFSYVFIKIQGHQNEEDSALALMPPVLQSVFTYGQFTMKGREELDKCCIRRINCKKN